MLASKNGNVCFSKEIVMLFSSHATVAPGSENHETLVETCTLKRKTEGANKKLDLICIFNRFVRCASSPPSPLLLP